MYVVDDPIDPRYAANSQFFRTYHTLSEIRGMNLRHLLLLSTAALALTAGTASAQSTDDYRSAASGVWGTASNWERYNGASWVAAATAPTSANGVITVRSGHTMTIGADVTIDQTVIAAGGTVNANTNNRDIFVANGTGIDLDVFGTLKLTDNGATITRTSTSAEIKIESGGVYEHGQNAGWVVLATWADGSTAKLNGNGTNATAIDSLDQSFYNLVWDMAGAGGGGSKNAYELSTIRNDFTILNISGTSLEFAQNAGHQRVITIGGDWIISHPAQKVTINQGPADMIVEVGGDLIKDDAGLFEMSGGNGTGSVELDGNFTHTGGEITEQVPEECWIRFVGASDQTAYTYDEDQMTNSINVETNKPGGRLLLGSNFRVNGTAILRMTQGNILTYSYILTLGHSTTLLGTLEWFDGTIVGYFRRWYAASTVANVLYPIGTEIWHRPAVLSFTAAPTSGGTVTGSFHEIDPGSYGLPVSDNLNTYTSTCPDGYWTMTAGNSLAGGTYNIDLTATGFSCVVDPAQLAVLKRVDNLSPWTVQGTHSTGTGTIAVPTAHRVGLTSFSDFAITGDGGDTPLPIELAEFNVTSSNGQVNVVWRTGAEVNNEGFEVQRATESEEEFRTIASYRTNPELTGLGTSFVGKGYDFVDDGSFGVLVAGAIYRYRLIDVSRDGSRTVHPERSVRIEGKTVTTPGLARFALGAAAPNPATDALNVVFSLAEPSPVTIEVYSADGRVVSTPVSAIEYGDGAYPVTVDTRDLRPGSYTLRLITGQGVRSQQFLIVR
jgi:hypothetical protein